MRRAFRRTNDYVFAPANFAPITIFGLNKRISKTVPAAAVVDSKALGKLYTSPVTLARFKSDAGTTNRGSVRMELNAVFGGERTAAAVRIAASLPRSPSPTGTSRPSRPRSPASDRPFGVVSLLAPPPTATCTRASRSTNCSGRARVTT
jgi:hypothetical protein